MYRPRNAQTARRRRGIILLVVLVMLTLFAVVGLTFVFYADTQAQSSRTIREAVNVKLPEVDPETAFALFLNQMIYDGADDQAVLSAMRGHSLMRNMYGFNDAATNFTPFNGVGRLRGDKLTFSWNDSSGAVKTATLDSFDLINYQCFLDASGNFVDTFNPGNGPQQPSFSDSVVNGVTKKPRIGNIRDPERLGVRDDTGNGIKHNIGSLGARGLFTSGFNPGYTYPDFNSVFLAAVKADGTVLVPSFHRSWGAFGSLDSSNPNWTANSFSKYTVLRPRPVDNLTKAQLTAAGLPYPLMPESLTAAQMKTLTNLIASLQTQFQLFPNTEDAGGDVKNLVGTPGGNDSMWMDLGAPVMTMADGRKFKMMYAPLITDLDGRFSVNAGGNIRGLDFTNPNLKSPNLSLSNMGLGAWEISPQYVFTSNFNQTGVLQPIKDASGNNEWPNMLIGSTRGGIVNKWGKYGRDQLPAVGGNAPGGSGAPNFYASVDLDSADEGQGGKPTTSFTLPTVGAVATFPTFPATGYGNNLGTEGTAHPLLFDNFASSLYNANNNDRIFQASNMAALLRFGDTGAEFLGSDLLALCPVSFSDPRVRRLVTTHSFDPNRATNSPWIYDRRNGNNIYQLAALGSQYPTGQAVPFPALTSRYDPITTNSVASPTGSDFADNDWRSTSITRSLAATATTPAFSFDGSIRFELTTPLYQFDQAAGKRLYDYPTPGADGRIAAADLAQFTKAQNARVDMAAQLYYRMVRATGAFDPFTYDPAAKPAVTPSAAEVDALRWLAQLAVNMVDYIDNDDYITPFNWGQYGGKDAATTLLWQTQYSGEWVYGTELPRVVLNEAYAEYVNIPGQPKNMAATQFDVNMWIELHNPFDDDNNLVDQILKAQGNVGTKSIGRLQVPVSGMQPAYPVYMVSLSKPNLGLSTNNNVFGNPDLSNINAIGAAPNGNILTYKSGNQDQLSVVTDFTPTDKTVDTTYILPGNRKYAAPNNQRGSIGKDANGQVAGADTFYMLGPQVDFPYDSTVLKGNPKASPPAATLRTAQMNYRFDWANNNNKTPDDSTVLPTVMLHRLLCPNLPPQPDPADPKKLGYYNPYITVDYMDSVLVNNAADIDVTLTNPKLKTPIQQRKSVGKRQPYASHTDLDNRRPQAPKLRVPNPNTNPAIKQNDPLPNQPQHSFFQHNVDANTAGPNSTITEDWANNTNTNPQYPEANRPFDWLTHLDRPLTSPLDLLQVSGFKPHQLTQQFMLFPNNLLLRFQHRVNWFDDTARVYRLFESVQTPPLAINTIKDGRVAGRINLNSIWDPETFLALCDPQIANYFQLGDLYKPLAATSPNMDNTKDDPVNPSTIYWRMIQMKTGASDLNKVAGPNGSDQPFLSVASTGNFPAGDTQYPAGAGTQSTFLRPASNVANGVALPRLFQKISAGFDKNGKPTLTDPDPNGHPYFKYQLMNKIFNNVTVRSNVFAVWVTVGFFEVTDDTTMPVKLGAEIGRSENKHVRHRMFAIIDRTAVNYFATTSNTPVVAAGSNVITPAAFTGSGSNGNAWSFSVNDRLVVDPGPSGEIVTVTAVDNVNKTITATFQNVHLPNFVITNNTGPQARFNPHSPPSNANGLVLYFSIID